MRKPNQQHFAEYAAIQGRLWREELSVVSRIPFELLDRGLKGRRKFTEAEMDCLCRAMSKKKDDLFPVSKQEKIAV